jgi:hypothetical protein
MSSMQIDLYDAMTSANIPADKAKAVVESLQEHIEMQVSRANEAVLAKLDGVQGTLVAKLDALVSGRIEPIDKAVGQLVADKQLRVQRTRWVVGTALTMLGLMSAGAGTLHALHVF